MPSGVYDNSKRKGMFKKGVRFSDEFKKKMRGIKRSIATRRKMSERMKREKHWNWKGGYCIRNKKQYLDINYRLFREAVFERDKYTCQECGVSGVYITAHHIKSWANYPDLRYELKNGLTLCEDCHSKTDNYKGRNIGKNKIKKL